MSTAPGLGALVVGGVVGAAAGLAAVSMRAGPAARARNRVGADLARTAVPGWFEAALSKAELRLDSTDAWPWAQLVGGCAAAVVAWRWPAAGVVGVALVAAWWRVGSRPTADHDRAVLAALPAALDTVVAALGSGASLAQAVARAGERSDPAGRDLAGVARSHRLGVPLQDALDAWAARRPAAGVGLVVDALALAGRSGGSQAAALRSVGDTLREQEALSREVRALGAQAQLSASVLVAVPVAFALVVALLDRRIALFLLGTGAGWACLFGGLVLDLAGAWWMRRLMRQLT